jgi:hypothetical protein
LNGGGIEHALWLLEAAVASPKNQADILFEVETRGVVERSHTDAYYRWGAENGDRGGTYWDEWVTMKCRKIAHFSQGKENRWSAHPKMVRLKAFWVLPTALASARIG